MQSLFVKDGSSLTPQLVERVQYAHHFHENNDCEGCALCLSQLVVFPEGTTTNGKALLRFRTGVFNAGCPVRPVLVKFPYKHFNPSWESMRFRPHFYRCLTQFRNNVEFIILPPYIPSKEEKEDSVLYATNVQNLMAYVSKEPIYMLNRLQKVKGYHRFLTDKNFTEKQALEYGIKVFLFPFLFLSLPPPSFFNFFFQSIETKTIYL